MKNQILRFDGLIENVSYTPRFNTQRLNEYNIDDFDVTQNSSTGIITFNEESRLTYSFWVSPKRTRSFPLSRVYSTYHAEKVVTVIPIIKDEGKNGDFDRLNFITLSWLNLMNIYIVLAWYDKAEKKDDNKITQQKFNNEYVKEQLEKISSYKLDAHHWNNNHFINDYSTILEKASNSYKRIGHSLNVNMHDPDNNINYYNQVKNLENEKLLDLERYKERTLTYSERSALNESVTLHELEFLSEDTNKGIFSMKNNLGGEYILTCDEVIINENNSIIIQESKNTSVHKIPTVNDIKDGLFKLILFSNISKLELSGKSIDFTTRLRLTGNLNSELYLPAKESDIETFIMNNELSNNEGNRLELMNLEAFNNNITIFLGSNK